MTYFRHLAFVMLFATFVGACSGGGGSGGSGGSQNEGGSFVSGLVASQGVTSAASPIALPSPSSSVTVSAGHIGGLGAFATGHSDSITFYLIGDSTTDVHVISDITDYSDAETLALRLESEEGGTLFLTAMSRLAAPDGSFSFPDPDAIPLTVGHLPVGSSGMVALGERGVGDSREVAYVAFGITRDELESGVMRSGATGVSDASTLNYHGHAIASTPDLGQTYRGKATVELEIAGEDAARPGEASVTSHLDFTRTGGGSFTLRSDPMGREDFIQNKGDVPFASGDFDWPALGAVQTYNAFFGLYGTRPTQSLIDELSRNIDISNALTEDELSEYGYASAAERDEDVRRAEWVIYSFQALIPQLEEVPAGMATLPENVVGSFGLYDGNDNPALFGGYASWPVRR